jgi:hypothetical protein
MAASKPVGWIAQVDPGKYVDQANNIWTGTKDAPVYGGVWTGPTPTSYVNVYGNPNLGPSPNVGAPGPSTSTTPPPGPTSTPPTAPTPAPTPAPAPTRNVAPTPMPTPPTFDPRLSDPVWANTPEGLEEANKQDIYNQLQQRLRAAQRPGMETATPAGWDPNKWGDEGRQTTKYVVGRILAKYPPTTAGMNQAWAELKDLFPGATFNGKDTISGLPGTQGPVDVLVGAGAGGTGWAWQDTGAEAPGGPATAPTPTTTPTPYAPLPPTQSGTVADAAAYLNKINRTLGGGDLTPEQLAEAGRLVGYVDGQPVTGAQLNTIVAEMYRRAGKPLPPTTTPPPTTTTTRPPTPPTPPTTTTTTGTGGGPPTTTGTGPTTNPTQSPDVLAEFRQALLDRLRDINSPLDEDAAHIREPLSAARNEASRVTDQERTALAERLYAQGGLNTNALTQGIQQSSERNAIGLGGLRAQLITREYDARRADLKDLLAQATASGDNASARAIQKELAELEATLRREGIGADLAKYSAYLSQNAVLNGLR